MKNINKTANNKRLLNGADVKTVISLLEGLRVDALGMNCGLDPRNIKDIVEEFLQYSSLPLVLKPNTGIPENINGEIKFNMEPDDFGKIMREFVEMGANIVGGCCGTTHDHIRRLYEETCKLPLIAARNREKKFRQYRVYSCIHGVPFHDLTWHCGHKHK